MTWLVSIDESGSLGRDSRFFVMAAVIVMRPRSLLNVAKQIQKLYFESKFYNSTREEITNVLRTLSECDVFENKVLSRECTKSVNEAYKLIGYESPKTFDRPSEHS